MASVKRLPDGSLIVKLSARDTYDWAHRPGASWPGSQLADRRVVAEFDSRGDLVDLSIDGGRGEQDVDETEFTACTSDFIARHFPDHEAVKFAREF